MKCGTVLGINELLDHAHAVDSILVSAPPHAPIAEIAGPSYARSAQPTVRLTPEEASSAIQGSLGGTIDS